MQVDQGVFELAMSQKYLDGAQVSASLQQVSREAMPQGVRGDMFLDARAPSGFLARFPGRFGRNRQIATASLDRPRKEIRLGLHPAPIDTQRLQQFLAQREIAVVSAFALTDVDDHTAAVNLGDLQAAQFGAAYPGGIQC